MSFSSKRSGEYKANFEFRNSVDPKFQKLDFQWSQTLSDEMADVLIARLSGPISDRNVFSESDCIMILDLCSTVQ